MGVEVSYDFGIGVEITPHDISQSDYDMDEYLDYILGDHPLMFDLKCFRIGSSWTGEKRYYLCIDEPFKDGFEAFIDKKEAFKQYLLSHKIPHEGKIDLVGGAYYF